MTAFATVREHDPKALPDLLIRYDEDLLSVTTAELPTYLTALLNALFFKAAKETQLSDPETAKQALQDSKRLQSLFGVAENALGTHNLKYPNANVGQGAIFAQAACATPASQPWVSSRTVTLARTLGGAGNAAWAAEIRFLCAEFLLDGARIRMAEVLAAQDGAVYAALQALGLRTADADKLGVILRDRLRHPDRGNLDRLSKQVFFPLRDGQDVVITPVQHFGLAREFHNRFFQRISKDNPQRESFQTRSLKVGGANPINAGPYNAELGGLYRHLLAHAPTRQTDEMLADQTFEQRGRTLLARLRERGTVFPRPKQLEIDLTRLMRPVVGRSSRINRRVHASAAAAIARSLLEDATDLATWLARQADDVLADAAFNHMEVLERTWLDPRRTTRLGQAQIQAMCGRTMGLLKSATLFQLDANGTRVTDASDLMLSASDEGLVREALRTLIEEF